MSTITINEECTDITHDHRAAPDLEPWLEFEGTRHADAPGPDDLAEYDPRAFMICDTRAQYWEV